MAINWDKYQWFEEFEGFEIFRRQEGNIPKYAFRGIDKLVKGAWGTAEHLTDARTIIVEHAKVNFGNGIASGYLRTKMPGPETIYRGVAIGKYLYRENVVDLPKFMAVVRPYELDHPTFRLPYGVAQTVTGDTIEDVKKLITKTIKGYPKKYHFLFSDK